MFGRRRVFWLISEIANIMVWANRNSLKLTLKHTKKKYCRKLGFTVILVLKWPLLGAGESRWCLCEGKCKFRDFAVNRKNSSNHHFSLFGQQREFWTGQNLTGSSVVICSCKYKQKLDEKQVSDHNRHVLSTDPDQERLHSESMITFIILVDSSFKCKLSDQSELETF